MSKGSARLKRYRRAREELKRLEDNEPAIHIVHYSCEDFINCPEGRSPRVTSIAVRNLRSDQTRSFSIHQVGERNQLDPNEIELRYDELELQMLDDFSDFVSNSQNQVWMHWNMRDQKYGFPALEHRHRVLQGTPRSIDDSRKVNLARLLIDLYGAEYAPHPRLEGLLDLNSIGKSDFLTGPDEAEAFKKGEFVKLHNSTLRKVDALVDVYERVQNGTLKTAGKPWSVYPSSLRWVAETIQRNPFWVLLMLLGCIASIFGLLFR